MSALPLLPFAVASLILVAGVVDDLRSKKVHNWLFLTCTAIAVVTGVIHSGLVGLNFALLGFLAGLLTLLPFVLLKIIGAGDMKLFAAFGAVAGWSTTVDVAIFALIWGALFGIVTVIVKGQFKATVQNMLAIAGMKDHTQLMLHKMPFTVALLMGWLSHLTLHGALHGVIR